MKPAAAPLELYFAILAQLELGERILTENRKTALPGGLSKAATPNDQEGSFMR